MQVVDFPTRFPSNADGQASPLDSCLTLQLCPLGNSDHAMVSTDIYFCSPISHEPPINKIRHCYEGADWGSFRDFLRDVISNDIFFWVNADTEAFVPARDSRYSPHKSLLKSIPDRQTWL